MLCATQAGAGADAGDGGVVAAASGNGAVHACSVVMGKPGTNTDYAVVLVDLQEGARMMSNVVDCDPHTVKIGMPLKARIVEKEGKPLVVFAPANQAGGAQ